MLIVLAHWLKDHQKGFLKTNPLGTSLVVQWLGLYTFTARAWVWSLAGELGSHTWPKKNRKVSYKMESETAAMNFLYYLDLVLMDDFIIGNSENIGPLDYELFQMLIHFITLYWKITLINVTTNYITKVFRYWKVVTLTVANTSFPKS